MGDANTNEIALYGLSSDGGVTLPNGPDGIPHLVSMTKSEAASDNRFIEDSGLKERWCFVCSIPAALNAEKNERAVKVCLPALEHAKTMMLNAGCRQPELEPVMQAIVALKQTEGE